MSNTFVTRYTPTKNRPEQNLASSGWTKFNQIERRERVARLRKYPRDLRIAIETEELDDDVFEDPKDEVVVDSKTNEPSKPGIKTTAKKFEMPKLIQFSSAIATSTITIEASFTPPTVPIFNSSTTNTFNFDALPPYQVASTQSFIGKRLQHLHREDLRRRQFQRDRAFRGLRCSSGSSD